MMEKRKSFAKFRMQHSIYRIQGHMGPLRSGMALYPISLFPTYTVATGYKVTFCLRGNHCICGFKSHFTLCPVTSVSTVLYSGKRLREQLAHRHELVLADHPVAVRVEGVELGSQRLGVHAVLIFIIIISYGYHRKHISIIYAV